MRTAELGHIILTKQTPSARRTRENGSKGLRLHHHRRGLGRLRPGRPPDRGRHQERAAAGGRRARQSPLHQGAARPRQAARPQDVRLGLRLRGGASARRSRGGGHARQGARRPLDHQRHGLRAGQPRRYERWQRKGAKGWSYADVPPYFKRNETFAEGPDTWRGGEGSASSLAARPIRYGMTGSMPPRSPAIRSTPTSTARSSSALAL